MQVNFPFSPEVVIGIALITFGVFTFAKGTSNHMANDNFIKSKNQINKLVDTIIEAKDININSKSK